MSDHFDNGRFFNPNGADAQPFWKAPRMLFERYAPWPAQVPVVQRPAPPPTSGDEIVVTFRSYRWSSPLRPTLVDSRNI